jgi:hypothetical protein
MRNEKQQQEKNGHATTCTQKRSQIDMQKIKKNTNGPKPECEGTTFLKGLRGDTAGILALAVLEDVRSGGDGSVAARTDERRLAVAQVRVARVQRVQGSALGLLAAGRVRVQRH